ncbi:MAG: transcription antitermination factor NusB [Anaerovoracaceae bacterium]
MTRTKAREVLMQLCYIMEAQCDFSLNTKDVFFQDFNIKEDGFMEVVYTVLIEKIDEMNNLLNSASENWSISRINKVDLAVLRVSLSELLSDLKTPEKVVINEAVNLAKKYGSDDSGRFVNGVLGGIVKKLRVE